MISIIVPVYNVSAFLPQCIDSLINQTYRDIEIICVNDGSVDNSLEILNEYARKDKRICVLSRENRGISASRNEAIAHSKGEWILFVDSDDWIDTDTCFNALKSAESNDADVVFWSYVREFPSLSLPKYICNENRIWHDAPDCRRLHRRIVGPVGEELAFPDKLNAWGTLWGKLYRRSIIDEHRIKLIDTKEIGSAEDVLFNVAYFTWVRKVVYLHQCSYHYRRATGGSFTAFYKPDLQEKWNNLYSLINTHITYHELGPDFTEALNNRIVQGLIGLGLNELCGKNSASFKRKRIKSFLTNEKYRQAIADMPLDYFPLHWKLFFFCASHRLVWGVYILLLSIRKITNH